MLSQSDCPIDPTLEPSFGSTFNERAVSIGVEHVDAKNKYLKQTVAAISARV
jgi:hypothetical protein